MGFFISTHSKWGDPLKLTEHFSLSEFTFTSTGLPNIPSDVEIERLKRTAMAMEEVRGVLGYPIHINSGYRSEVVNRAAGGAKNSAHMRGEAVDFVCSEFGTPKQICMMLIDSGLHWDQLILEPGWVHVGFGDKMRQQVMTKIPGGYSPGLHGVA